MNAIEKLNNRLSENKHICVGLDTDLNKIPKHLLGEDEPILEFNKNVIAATKEHAVAYKLNFAFYEALGSKGFDLIKKTLEYIPSNILTIADAKRGDIGNTCLKYAEAVFDELNFDAITLAPYMGIDSIEPFMNYKNKIHFVLGLTSNSSNIDFEKLKLSNGKYLYQEVISKINSWNEYGNMGVVFGATNLEELISNIELLKSLFVLLPGVGAQGGSLSEIHKIFRSNNLNNHIVNISRGIIYCDTSENYVSKIEQKMKQYQDELS